MEPQTYRVKLSDGREFDVQAEGGPPSADDILAALEPPATPEPEPVAEASIPGRVLSGAWQGLKGMAQFGAKASGMQGLFGIGTDDGRPEAFRAGVPAAVWDQAQTLKNVFYDAPKAQFEKAMTAPTWTEAAGHAVAGALPVVGPMAAHAGEEIAAGRAPELAGEVLSGLVIPGGVKAGSGAQKALAARTVRQADKAMKAADMNLRLAFPKADPKVIQQARPYLNEQFAGKAPQTTGELIGALNRASSAIETRVKGYLDEFQHDRLAPKVLDTVREKLAGHPRADFVDDALKNLDSFDLDRPRSPGEWDAVRAQLNAENQSVLEGTGAKKATARKTNPGFAAREIAAEQIRDAVYGHLEARGVPGVADLRRDSGALIQLRKAVEPQKLRGENKVAGSAPESAIRNIAGEVVDKLAPLPGVVTQPIARAIKGQRSTRDALVARAFGVKDTRLPTYPEIPKRAPVAGYLPESTEARVHGKPVTASSGEVITPRSPARPGLPPGPMASVAPEVDAYGRIVAPAGGPRGPIAAGPSSVPDTSGRIEPTLPEHYVREQASLDEAFGKRAEPVKAAADERTFMLRWLADDLKEQGFQQSSRMRGTAAADEWQGRAYGEEATNYAPRVAGTPTQEMFHALGIKGSRLEIADRLDRFMRGEKVKGRQQLEALADAMREAWDGQRFDFEILSDETISRLGIRRRDLREPISSPHVSDMPDVYERLFPERSASDRPKGGADDFEFEDDK